MKKMTERKEGKARQARGKHKKGNHTKCARLGRNRKENCTWRNLPSTIMSPWHCLGKQWYLTNVFVCSRDSSHFTDVRMLPVHPSRGVTQMESTCLLPPHSRLLSYQRRYQGSVRETRFSLLCICDLSRYPRWAIGRGESPTSGL